MGWDQVVEAHLRVLRQLHDADTIAELAKQWGVAITPEGNRARSAEDASRYMGALEQVLGRVPAMSAKMKMTGKARELGLEFNTLAQPV